MGTVIAVSSGKGGTGKTTAVAAISSCLAAMGHKTLCIDMDTGMGNLDLALGMAEFTVMDYTDVINAMTAGAGRASGNADGGAAGNNSGAAGKIITDTCSRSPHIQNLYFLAAPPAGGPSGGAGEGFTDMLGESFTDMLGEIRRHFDYCLLDCPSGIGPAFTLANSNADMSIIVTTGELPAMRDASRAAGMLRDMGIGNIRLLVNKVRAGNLSYIRTTVDDIIDTTGVQLIGLIPEDKYVFRAIHEGIPLIIYYKRKSAYDFLDAACRVTGEMVPLRQR